MLQLRTQIIDALQFRTQIIDTLQLRTQIVVYIFIALGSQGDIDQHCERSSRGMLSSKLEMNATVVTCGRVEGAGTGATERPISSPLSVKPYTKEFLV